VRMHKGKDGHVRQLCGPGITHLLLGRAKQVHVHQRKVLARVEEKNRCAATQGCIKSSRPRGMTWCGRQARLEDSDDT
jgi:hypothetical protein